MSEDEAILAASLAVLRAESHLAHVSSRHALFGSSIIRSSDEQSKHNLDFHEAKDRLRKALELYQLQMSLSKDRMEVVIDKSDSQANAETISVEDSS